MLIYYVYAYLRADGTPYYIGKGKGDRAFQIKGHIVKPPKDKSKIVFCETNLTEIGALAIERWLIRWYGRKDLNTGILRNRTDGGDGVSGLKHTTECKRRMSSLKIGKPPAWEFTPEICKKISNRKSGVPKSEEHKEKLRQVNLGKTITIDVRLKMSESMKGKNRVPCSPEKRALIALRTREAMQRPEVQEKLRKKREKKNERNENSQVCI